VRARKELAGDPDVPFLCPFVAPEETTSKKAPIIRDDGSTVKDTIIQTRWLCAHSGGTLSEVNSIQKRELSA